MRSPESLDPPSGEGRGACVRMCLREKSPEHRLQPKLCASGWFLSLVLYSLPPTASEAGAGGTAGHATFPGGRAPFVWMGSVLETYVFS